MKILLVLSVIFLASNALPFGEHLSQAQNANGETYVVLVAGSNTYDNYRHQADVYHAYQVVLNHGIPEKNIIVFHYDDIAQNEQNPTKGIVINKPNGPDVYHGVPKDYTGADVNPENFLAVLKGDQKSVPKGKKVLHSGPNDHVFVYFADHGAPDLIAFPVKYLYGEDLNKALEYMHQKKMYSKLVFYLEACESGSMFNTLLPKNINIYATTAANPSESSYAVYYDDKRQTYLGDVYSVNWIENSDRKSLGKETLLDQFKIVRKETNTSHVEEYGDLTIASLPLTQFQGDKQSSRQLIGGDERPLTRDAVDSGEVPVHIIVNKIAAAKDELEKKIYDEELQRVLNGREYLIYHLKGFVDSIKHLVGDEVNSIINRKQEYNSVNHQNCYRKLVDTFHRECLNLNKHSYTLRKLHVFVNVCEELHRKSESNEDKELSVNDAVNHLNDYCHENLDESYPTSIV